MRKGTRCQSPSLFAYSDAMSQLWELRLEMVCGKGKESSLRVLFASLLEKNTSDQIGRRTTFLFRLIIRSKRLAATLSKSSMGSSANSYPQRNQRAHTDDQNHSPVATCSLLCWFFDFIFELVSSFTHRLGYSSLHSFGPGLAPP